MIVITGAAGFIGSVLIDKLSRSGRKDLVLVDRFGRPERRPNYVGKDYQSQIERDDLMSWMESRPEGSIDIVYHIGARTDTAEQDEQLLDKLNTSFTKDLWRICSERSIPFIYASSAATYGGGEEGYSDDHAVVPRLRPLNPYGWSKQRFDEWALEQTKTPPFWAGLKFFNVYGPNEYHKGRMASVIFHAFGQIERTGGMRLFRSHKAGIADGEQRRDFISVFDVVDVLQWLGDQQPDSGLYNLGTGKAETFLELAHAVFRAMGSEPKIEFIDTPVDIRDNYQYFTEAEMEKLRSVGYDRPFTSLEEGIDRYVKQYLRPGLYV